MAVLVYTLLRVALIGAVAIVLYALGLRGLALVAVSVVVGALLSYLLLAGPRQQAATTLQRFAERNPRPVARDEDAIAEDEALDAAQAGDTDTPSAEGQREQ